MSDSSSEDEDLSRFKEAVDTSFSKLINESRGIEQLSTKGVPQQKSERYLDVSSHYNDVKVPERMQKQIGDKVSAVIQKNVEFVDNIQENGVKKRKIKGGIKLFSDSSEFLSCEEPKDNYTKNHNKKSKKLKKERKTIEDDLNEDDKVSAVVVSGDYVLSKEETKCWKSRRKEKLFKYKSQGKSKVLTAVE